MEDTRTGYSPSSLKPFTVYLSIGEMIAELKLFALDADHARDNVRANALSHFTGGDVPLSILDVKETR